MSAARCCVLGVLPAKKRMRLAPNKQMHRTATERCGFYHHRRQAAVVAVASALPVAVGDLGRWPTSVMRSSFIGIVYVAVLVLAWMPGGAADDLRRMWTVRTNSVEELATAINKQFTNGTPMGQVVRVLGRQDTMYITTTLSWPPETQNQRVWVYRFGSREILVRSTGGATTPLSDRGFAGAQAVPRDKPGQPQRGADGSQPSGSPTNRTSAAAGSRGSR